MSADRVPTARELNCEDEPKLGRFVDDDGIEHTGMRETQIRAIWPDQADRYIEAAGQSEDDELEDLKRRLLELERRRGRT